MLVSFSAKPFVEYEPGRLLRSALRLCDAEVARCLIQRGSSVKVETSTYQERRETPLHVAISLGLSDIVAMLLDRQADVNARNPSRQTPLHLAVTAIYFQENDPIHVAGFYVDKKLQALIPNTFKSLTELLERELAELRSEKIRGISFFELLKKTSNEMAILVKNKIVAAAVFKTKNIFKRFPKYAPMLIAQYFKGVNRAKLLDEVPLTFYESNVLYLPYVCVEKIIHYLSDGDLKKLNDACKRPSCKGMPLRGDVSLKRGTGTPLFSRPRLLFWKRSVREVESGFPIPG